MKKLYTITYIISLLFIFFFLIYIAIFDVRHDTRPYISSNDITIWTDYQIYQEHGDIRLEGDISTNFGINNVLTFYSTHQDIIVYCDNQLIYEYPVLNNNPFSASAGYNWNFVILPKADCHLSIYISSPYNGYAENLPIFYSSSIPAGISQIFKIHLLPFLICFFMLFIGIFMIAYWLYIRFQMPIDENLLFLGIFTIILSLWSGNESQFTTLLFKSNLACSYLSFLTLMLLPFQFSLFVRSYYQDTNKIWDVFCTINIAQIVLCIVLQILKIVDLRNTLWTTHIILILLIITVFSSSIRLLKQRINSTKVKMNLICIFLCIITLGIDLVAFYIGVLDSNTFGRIGFLVYINLLGISSIKESAELMKLGKKANAYQHLAYTDQMTKTSNRTAFHRDFEIFSTSPDDIAIIILDLNNLKQINDSLGHDYGDNYIINSAKIISDTFSHVGKCYRVGGDEFVIIIENASHFDFGYYFNIMEWCISSFNTESKNIPMQIAYGYAIYDTNTDSTLNDTYHRADKNMYENKKEKKKIRS